MGTIAAQDEQSPDQAFIRLYGLPEIMIAQAQPGQVWKVPGLVPETLARESSRKWYHLINLGSDLDFMCSSDEVRDYILITQTGEKPLLKTYAYLKAMHARHGQSRLHVVFDDAPSGEEAERLFNRFNGFVKRHLGVSVRFLGNLIQDETLQRSIVERRPLVLARDRGETGMTSICTRFLDTLESGTTRLMEVD